MLNSSRPRRLVIIITIAVLLLMAMSVVIDRLEGNRTTEAEYRRHGKTEGPSEVSVASGERIPFRVPRTAREYGAVTQRRSHRVVRCSWQDLGPHRWVVDRALTDDATWVERDQSTVELEGNGFLVDDRQLGWGVVETENRDTVAYKVIGGSCQTRRVAPGRRLIVVRVDSSVEKLGSDVVAFINGCGIADVPVVQFSPPMFFGAIDSCVVTMRVLDLDGSMWVGSRTVNHHPSYGEVTFYSTGFRPGTGTVHDLESLERRAALMSRLIELGALPRGADEPFLAALERLPVTHEDTGHM